MNDTPTIAPAPRQAAWPGTTTDQADALRRRHSLATLPGMIAAWRRRIRFRRELEEMSKANPHMIADIGLKGWQVEAEIAKPFWRP